MGAAWLCRCAVDRPRSPGADNDGDVADARAPKRARRASGTAGNGDTSVGAAGGGAGYAAAQTIDMLAKVRLESVERRLPETAAVPRTLQSRGGGGAQRSVSALR